MLRQSHRPDGVTVEEMNARSKQVVPVDRFFLPNVTFIIHNTGRLASGTTCTVVHIAKQANDFKTNFPSEKTNHFRLHGDRVSTET